MMTTNIIDIFWILNNVLLNKVKKLQLFYARVEKTSPEGDMQTKSQPSNQAANIKIMTLFVLFHSLYRSKQN
jgi:hypothetical protein